MLSYWSVEDEDCGASDAMARPRTPAVRNSAPPRGTNSRRPAPRASIARDTLFALSGRIADPPLAVRSGHAASDALGSRTDLLASSDVSSGCATRVWSGGTVTGNISE